MGVFRAFFGCRGVVGFNGCCSGASNGDGGFMLACVSACRGVTGFICPLPERWAGLLRGRRPAQLMVLLVGPRVFRVSEGPAAREARRPHVVRRVASEPARPHRWSLRPERSGLKLRDLALHSGVVSAKIIVSTPTWRVIRPPVR